MQSRASELFKTSKIITKLLLSSEIHDFRKYFFFEVQKKNIPGTNVPQPLKD